MMHETITNERNGLPLSTACTALSMSRAWYHKKSIKNDACPEGLLEQIQSITQEFPGYGYRRVTKELHRRETKINHKKVLKTMRKHGLLHKKKKFRFVTTDSNHGLRTYSNLIKELNVVELNQVWVADITYIRFANNKTVYLATILDRHSRKCVGWQLSHCIDAQLCLDALHNAFEERKEINLSGLIHHSDQGVQYASNEYVAQLEKRNILVSMSRKGNPYDNAHAESFFKTIKYEEVYMDEYQSFEDAYINLKHFIEEVYNKKRLHSSIGYIPPAEFEEQYTLKEVVA